MKGWAWYVLGFATCALGVLLIRGTPSEEVQRLRDRIAADSLRSVQTDSLLAVRDSAVVRWKAIGDSQRAEIARLAPMAATALAAHQEARAASERAIAAIGQATTLKDTAAALQVALVETVRRAEAAEGALGATRGQLEATGRLVAIQDSTIRAQQEMLGAVRADRDRLRSDLTEAMATIGRMERRKGGFLSKVGEGAEIVGVGAATTKACEAGIGSFGCIAGVATTLAKVVKATT